MTNSQNRTTDEQKMTDETDNLPTFEPVKPIGKCGLCNNYLYPHSTCQNLARPDACPLEGDQWLQMKRIRATQNIYVA